MVIRFLHVVRDHILEGKHAVYVKVTGSGDQILLVGVFSCQLKGDEMAPVVQILSVDEIVFDAVPSRGLDRADALPVCRGHQVLADVRVGGAAASEAVEIAVALEGYGGFIGVIKNGYVVVDCDVRGS